MRCVMKVQAVLAGKDNGAAVTVVAVLVCMSMFILGCEAGGQFDYSCSDNGFCTGEAGWWVQYPAPD